MKTTINKNKGAHLKSLFLLICLLSIIHSTAQEVAILKYEGGGDWYANPTAVPNLIRFCNENIKTKLNEKPRNVETQSKEIYNFPIVFLTGHGNVFFSETDSNNLRDYLISGGFLHISDNYGLNDFIRKEMKKVFPELEFQEIPFDHAIYHQSYNFSTLPKIHEHDQAAAQGFGLFFEGRLICFYDYESDLSDGWEDEIVHNNPPEVRLKALQMGANIISYAFKN
ncbi:DUF4159 domain-containing protein [Lutimonas halocynthiae]|uniref:DUF4159 domain-containing protein n=1 Tax=Lutimonas halocynthiae TaxID=1446477 RepID=UPI0025B38D93|nr:DUF4159 domain-containing protein [Lutimonas halocynthiae]MDN3642369.1 DUF4159 domain-containing protein [Lutimonas halocynthiae]